MAARDVLGNRRIAIFMSDLFLRNRVWRGYLELTGYWKPLKICGRMLKMPTQASEAFNRLRPTASIQISEMQLLTA
jgi:hypothetical protein